MKIRLQKEWGWEQRGKGGGGEMQHIGDNKKKTKENIEGWRGNIKVVMSLRDTHNQKRELGEGKDEESHT